MAPTSPRPITGAGPGMAVPAMTTAPHVPASASGGRSWTTSAGSTPSASSDAARRRRARAGSGRRKASPAWRHPAAEHDALDVVGHDQLVDRTGDGRPTVSAIARARASPRGGARDRRRPRVHRPARIQRRSARPVRGPSLAARATAGPAARASRQPRSPHAQTGPSASRTTWPISPARPRVPRWSRPPRTTPAEIPVPTRGRRGRRRRRGAAARGARRPRRGRRSRRRTGRPAVPRARPSGRSCQPRLTASVTTPASGRRGRGRRGRWPRGPRRWQPAVASASSTPRAIVVDGAAPGRRRRSAESCGPGRRTSASTTRTATLLPPTSTPASSGRSRPSVIGRRRSSGHQAELAGHQQRGRAESDTCSPTPPSLDPGLARKRAERSGGWPRRGPRRATGRRGR